MSYDNKIESIKALIKESALAAKECNQILFCDDNDQKRNEFVAAVHLNKAIALMAAAKSLYISQYENLADTRVESIFESFSLFESEFLMNLRTDHSHQWTDLNFHDFKDAYETLLEEL